MGPGRITCCYPPLGLRKGTPPHGHPLGAAREGSSDPRQTQQRVRWPLSGGEAEGALLVFRELVLPWVTSMGPHLDPPL